MGHKHQQQVNVKFSFMKFEFLEAVIFQKHLRLRIELESVIVYHKYDLQKNF